MLQWINVSIGYGRSSESLALKNISVTLGEENFSCIVGLNGSGKSTFLRAALGLLTPTEGEILIRGRNLHNISAFERAKELSLLESEPHVTFPMTVRELLDISKGSSQFDLRKEALSCVGLEGLEDKNLLELSSGERKRAFIAHTLMSTPKLILLDEPLAHLDWSHQTHLIENLKDWNRRYSTRFIIALHELERALHLADRVLLLHLGKLAADGPPEKLFVLPEVLEIFAFQAEIDKNPLDGSKRLTLGKTRDTHNGK